MRVRTGALPLAVVLSLALPLAASAQSHWSWPEKAKNLKVLPEDTPPERLRAIMFGFTHSLGVRCLHCHAGKEGTPMSEVDFASDDNPNKDTARLMLKMVGAIRKDWISQVKTEAGRQPVEVRCYTCHHGLPRPVTLEETLSAEYASAGMDSTMARYQELRKRFYGSGSYDFGEDALNGLGYELLQGGHAEDAVTVFRQNAQQFPESGNVWDSLGEGLLAVGDSAQADTSYAKAVALDPRNRHAAEQLEKIRSGK